MTAGLSFPWPRFQLLMKMKADDQGKSCKRCLRWVSRQVHAPTMQ
jgi:hypothetical protein